jgi:hypothetical protein
LRNTALLAYLAASFSYGLPTPLQGLHGSTKHGCLSSDGSN